MIDATVLRAMLNAGATAEMIVVAVEALCASEDKRLLEQADRKRQYRLSQDVQGQKERSPTPPKEKLLPPEIAKTQSLPPRGWSEFWNTYPRKIGKGSALKSFRHALKRATSEEILAGAERFRAASTQTEQQFIPHPATWLNADRWADEVKSNIIGIGGPRRTWAEIKAEKAQA